MWPHAKEDAPAERHGRRLSVQWCLRHPGEECVHVLCPGGRSMAAHKGCGGTRRGLSLACESTQGRVERKIKRILAKGWLGGKELQ